MKKLVIVFGLISMILMSHIPVSDVCADYDSIIIYGRDGSEYLVYESELEKYVSEGFFARRDDAMKTLYAPDGREIRVWLSEADTYEKLGWYADKNQVIRTLYAPDGREAVVYTSQVPVYTALGWYENKSSVTTVMRAPDGRKITVYNSEVPSYINVGWTPVQNSAVDPSKPMLALTFDDGPRPASTGRILTALEAYNARATFFVVGYLAVENPQILQRMKSLGCQIGNHSYSHPDLAKLSAEGVANQLNTTANAVYNATGTYPTVIRPPYGSRNATVMSVAGQPVILWSIDTLDWKYRNSARVTNEVLSKAKDGDIVLMHDLYDTTASAAEAIIPALISRGFQLVTVDELAKYKNKPIYAHNAYSSIR